MLPTLILLVVVVAFPLVSAMYLSMTKGSLMKTSGFVGWANYVSLFSNREFLSALRFTAIFAVTSIAGCYVFGLGIALLLQKTLPARGLLRVLFLMPWVIPSVVAVAGWRQVIGSEDALANLFLRAIGQNTVYFLSDDTWAVISVIVIKIWRSIPFVMLSLLAGLQAIDRSLYEAAAIDGANRVQTFFNVTLPQLKTVSIVLSLMMAIWSVNDFETVWLLTQGGPGYATQNLVVLSYLYTFKRSNVGLGTAIAIMTLVVLMVLIVMSLRQQRQPK
ncbi:transporter [Kaistia sp. 32K]|uniref:carbohydrate ABC transporter permease n=1 Tax=Kaistia sp. 32K TaxID=2795690 RepID=UPI001938F751|nr:sugar ABC transporter permease [Kaistia sp. 32K]BCP52368.1 transporter [Kaistia sp. 32K]